MKSDKNPEKIKSMFNEIAIYYDRMNNYISLGMHYLIKTLAIKELKIIPRSNVLDLCCGTGDLVRIISTMYPRAKVMGLDFSEKMIKQAKIKNPKGIYLLGDCTKLPFKDYEFDFVTLGFGLRNIQNREKAICEIYRVLEHGGKFLHLDFGYHNIVGKIFDVVVPFVVNVLGKNNEHYAYLISSKNSFPQPNELVDEFEQHGFKCLKICNYLFGAISAQILEKA